MSGSREGTIAIIRFSEGKDPKEIKTTDAVQSLFIKESFMSSLTVRQLCIRRKDTAGNTLKWSLPFMGLMVCGAEI